MHEKWNAFKGTGSWDRSHMCGQKRIVLVRKKNFCWFLNLKIAPLIKCSHCHFHQRGTGENMLMKQYLSERYLLNVFFKIAKRLLEGPRGDMLWNLSADHEYVLLVHRNLLECSCGHLKYYWRVLNCDFEESFSKFFLQYIFSVSVWKMSIRTAHQSLIQSLKT
jgi:hypothetical protein